MQRVPWLILVLLASHSAYADPIFNVGSASLLVRVNFSQVKNANTGFSRTEITAPRMGKMGCDRCSLGTSFLPGTSLDTSIPFDSSEGDSPFSPGTYLATVPEPGTLFMMGGGLLVLAARIYTRRC